MWSDISFFNNPFDSPDYSRARKLLYANDQVSRLTALDPVVFAPRIAATQAAADFSLLQRRAVAAQHHTETGTLAPGAIVNLINEGLLPTTRLHLHNAGPVPLQFGLSKLPNKLFPGPGQAFRELQPAETLDLTAADLGDVAHLSYFNVLNPAESGADGRYEVTV